MIGPPFEPLAWLVASITGHQSKLCSPSKTVDQPATGLVINVCVLDILKLVFVCDNNTGTSSEHSNPLPLQPASALVPIGSRRGSPAPLPFSARVAEMAGSTNRTPLGKTLAGPSQPRQTSQKKSTTPFICASFILRFHPPLVHHRQSQSGRYCTYCTVLCSGLLEIFLRVSKDPNQRRWDTAVAVMQVSPILVGLSPKNWLCPFCHEHSTLLLLVRLEYISVEPSTPLLLLSLASNAKA